MLIPMNGTTALAALSNAKPMLQPSASAPGIASGAAQPFSELLSDAAGQVKQLESQAQQAVEGLMSGSGVDVHRAMIATEKADMAFEMVLAVRNKAVQAYQQMMSMQF